MNVLFNCFVYLEEVCRLVHEERVRIQKSLGVFKQRQTWCQRMESEREKMQHLAVPEKSTSSADGDDE